MTSPSGERANANDAHTRPSRIGMTRVEQDAAAILSPAGQGVEVPEAPDPVRAFTEAFASLADLPFVLEKIHKQLARLQVAQDIANGSTVWANTGENSNLAAVALGTGGTLPAFYNPASQNACVLRNILVGGSDAGTVQLVIARIANSGNAPNPALPAANIPYRVVSTVRLLTTMLTVIVPHYILLQPGESLHLITSKATPTSLDFAAEYRVLASE